MHPTRLAFPDGVTSTGYLSATRVARVERPVRILGG